MYTWTNKEENEAWEANYAECCKHKWTIEKWVKINGSWKRTNTYKRFDTLEDAREYALSDYVRNIIDKKYIPQLLSEE